VNKEELLEKLIGKIFLGFRTEKDKYSLSARSE
jgi:hypothetical protein